LTFAASFSARFFGLISLSGSPFGFITKRISIAYAPLQNQNEGPGTGNSVTSEPTTPLAGDLVHAGQGERGAEVEMAQRF
jgi:hypothetical protein